MISRSICSAIRWYKKVLSPKKGFSCAHRTVHKGDSCSTAVLKIVENKGMLAGLPEIVRRFCACRRAAIELVEAQRTDLDCGLAGCFDVGGSGGCLGDLFSAGGESAAGVRSCNCLFLGDPFALFTGKRGTRNLAIVLVLVVFGLLSGYFAYGNKVSAVEIKLLDPDVEDKDRKWRLVANSELPDYQVLLTLSGKEVKSDTVHNQSAVNWVSLTFPIAFPRGEIRKMEVTNRQLLSNKVLEAYSDVSMHGEGKLFKYRLIRRWDIF